MQEEYLLMVRQVRTVDKKKENIKVDGQKKKRGGGEGRKGEKERETKRKSENIGLVPCRKSQEDP